MPTGPPFRGDSGSFVVCPYCCEPLPVEVEERRLIEYRRDPHERAPVMCPVCALDSTRDAPTEEWPIEGRPHVACRHCGGSILAEAVYCHHCQSWQRMESET